MSLLTAVKASQIDNVSAQPGENVTICCQHNSETGKNIHWFKQTKSSVPIAIVYMMISYELKELHTNYLNGFQQDHLLMSLNTENTSLRILNVDVSDSGLYFCGWNSWMMTFGDGTQLEIKGNLSLSVTLLPISTKDCSENIFYKLTFIFGGIIFILTIILLTTLIIKIHNRNTQGKDADGHETQHHEEPHSSVYAALQFSKHKSRRAARNTDDTDVVYSATRYSTRSNTVAYCNV
uniref:Ig-like domain-containing protein n=1 Tax=Sinocyclocheilus anshuiensis TaxID=1608454 RepID=A0A671LTI2_9TELE